MIPHKRPWTAADTATLTARYPTTPTRALATIMGRSPEMLHVKASALGIRKAPSKRTEQTRKARAAAGARRAAEQVRRANDPTLIPYRRRLLKDATAALVKHGAEQAQAELMVHLVTIGRIPGVVVDY